MKNGKMGPKKSDTTKCDKCGKQYIKIMGNWQGDGCASIVEDNLLRCCYGSEYDGNVYLIDASETGIICDECIMKMLKNNKLKLLATDDLFHTYTLKNKE
jgi:hypothetical protein